MVFQQHHPRQVASTVSIPASEENATLSITLKKIALDNQLLGSRTHEGKRLRRFRVRRFHEGNWVTRFRVVRSEGTEHDPTEVRADTKTSKQKYLPGPVDGVRTRSVQDMRPSEPWGQTPMDFPGLRTKPTTPRRFAEYLSHLRTLVGEGVRVT